jgi:hypothetical protein
MTAPEQPQDELQDGPLQDEWSALAVLSGYVEVIARRLIALEAVRSSGEDQRALADVKRAMARVDTFIKNAPTLSMGRILPIAELNGRSFNVATISVDGRTIKVLVLDDSTPPTMTGDDGSRQVVQ